MMKILTVLSLLTFDMQQLKPKWLSAHLHFCRLLSVQLMCRCFNHSVLVLAEMTHCVQA